MTESKTTTTPHQRKTPVRKKKAPASTPPTMVRAAKNSPDAVSKAPKAVPSAPSGERYWSAVGRRKEATAKIKLFLGTGNRSVNGKPFHEYFPSEKLQGTVVAPLVALGMGESASFVVTTRGGGIGGQATAAQLAVARSLIAYDPNFKKSLRSHGFVTRDPRVKERKKYGLKRARRAPQWSKR